MNSFNRIEVAVKTEPDHKYRVLVQLRRSDRPKYWSFHCMQCKTFVCELNNTDIILADDFYNPRNTENQTVGVRCRGPHCRYWYFFKLTV